MAAKKRVDLPAAREIVPCAHASCSRPALLREKTGTGWANLCEHHYVEFHHKRAEQWCRDQGLDTVEKMKAFCREKLGTVFKALPEREPGCDDEPERRYMPGVEAKPVAGIEQ